MAHPPSRAEIADALESTEAEEEDAWFRQNLETERRLADAANVRADQADWVIAHLTRGGHYRSREAALEVPGRRGGLDSAATDGAARKGGLKAGANLHLPTGQSSLVAGKNAGNFADSGVRVRRRTCFRRSATVEPPTLVALIVAAQNSATRP
jgi:hypothetical protein